MIDLYTWTTPNGFKISIALEELGLEYRVHPVDIGAGDQHEPEFLAISPNNKIPAIVDQNGPGGAPLAMFESGAILLYLSEKTGQLLPSEPRGRWQAVQWLMFQMGGLGPMLGQAHHFLHYAPDEIPYAVERYSDEADRLYRVLDRRLADHEFFAGTYSIADIASFPWCRHPERQGVDLDRYPAVRRWRDAIAERPAVQRGLAVPDPSTSSRASAEETRDNLFGDRQHGRG